MSDAIKELHALLRKAVLGQVVEYRGRPAEVIMLQGKKTLRMMDTVQNVRFDGRKVIKTAKGGHSVQEA